MGQKNPNKTVGGALIVAGTCIGGGMLALPVITGIGGLVPSILLYLLCWLFMVGTGLLFVEICLWMKGESNLVSMAQKTLGPWGKAFAWLLYLFLFYSLTTAYCVGSGNIVQELLGQSLPDWAGSLIFLLIFGSVVAVGAAMVDRFNRIFMVSMGISFALFLILGFHEVDPDRLRHVDLRAAFLGLPVIFTSFGFQGTVPSLVHYMRYDVKRLRQAIVIGSLLPLLTYILWQSFVLGIVPEEALAEALEKGQNSVRPLKDVLQTPWVYTLGQLFAVTALVSSFMGVTLGLKDFLADGLSIEKDAKGCLILGLLTFGPPFLFSILFPNIFLKSLHYAGGFGVALLLGLLPVLMVWRGRYVLGLKGERLVKGGRWTLVVMILFVVLELCSEFYQIVYE